MFRNERYHWNYVVEVLKWGVEEIGRYLFRVSFRMGFIKILVMDFVVDCRRGIEHNYDIVEGPMADDQIWNFVESFIDGRIPRDAFWQIVKFNYPTHQIVFCTESALKTLTFEGSERLWKMFLHSKFFVWNYIKFRANWRERKACSRVILTDSTKCKGNLTIGTTILEKKCEISWFDKKSISCNNASDVEKLHRV